MEKQRDVAEFPNAAPKAAVDDAIRRAEALGYEWLDAVMKAGKSRNIAFTLKRGTASVASLRAVEDWLVKQEQTQRPKRPTEGAPISEWTALGTELLEIDPTEFARMLEGLREIVKAENAKRGAIRKMFRVNPDRPR